MPIKNRRITLKIFKYQAFHVHTKPSETIPLSCDPNLVTQSLYSKKSMKRQKSAQSMDWPLSLRLSCCTDKNPANPPTKTLKYQINIDLKVQQCPAKTKVGQKRCFSMGTGLVL
jgi:hypothetical protein